MHDQTLLKLSICCSIIGILILLILPKNQETINIKEITKEQVDKNIKIKGTIQEIRTTNKLTIITIKDSTGKIEASIFEKPDLKLKSQIELQGKVTEYQDKLQLQTNKIIAI